MPSTLPLRLLADVVLLLHFSVIFFVVGGLVFVVVGNLRAWTWVNDPWFRSVHLGVIGLVLTESWLDMPCPLTTLEAWLRPAEGATPYSQGFVEHWIERTFAYQVPPWMFSLTDAFIGLLALFAWWRFPPQRKHKAPKSAA